MPNHKLAAALLIAPLLVAAVAITDARLLEGVNMVQDLKAVSVLTCNKVHVMHQDDTCFSVARDFGLSEVQFFGFNPNLICEKCSSARAQWVCIDAATA